jgi:hypothetical protein
MTLLPPPPTYFALMLETAPLLERGHVGCFYHKNGF